MKTSWLLLLVFALLPSSVLLAQGEPAPASVPEPKRVVKLLTIGNSFAWNALQYLPKMAEADQNKLIYAAMNLSGYSLEQHAAGIRAHQADPADPKGRIYDNPKTRQKADYSLREALESTPWDYVTIQQASRLSYKKETFEPFAGELVQYIRKYAPQAKILVHETWAYREDHSLFATADGFTQAAMFLGLKSAYRELAARYQLEMIPVGEAFQAARAEERWKFRFPDPNFDYKNPEKDSIPKQPGSLNSGWIWEKSKKTGELQFKLDATHANNEGRFLAGATFYEVIFGNVEKNTFVPKGMEPEAAQQLREIAHMTVAKLKAEVK